MAYAPLERKGLSTKVSFMGLWVLVLLSLGNFS